MDIWAQRLYYQSARSLPCSPCSSSILSILLLCLPSSIRPTASVVPSSTVTNWHAEFSTGTLNPGDQAYRESSFISSPFGNCLCSSHGALGGFLHKGPMSLISNLLQGKEKNPSPPETSWGQLGVSFIRFNYIQHACSLHALLLTMQRKRRRPKHQSGLMLYL